MLVEIISKPEVTTTAEANSVIFSTLPESGLDRMTEGQVEFVLCASALTAQV
jgi:hypothetical protein